MSDPAVHLEGVTHTYPRGSGQPPRPVLRGVDLTVRAGQVLGLFGVNGAGKSTTTRMVLGFHEPGQGRCRVLGGSPRDESVRARMGYAPENPAHYDFLTARESMDFTARLFGPVPDAPWLESLLATVGLASEADRRISSFSKGMKQRLAIAQALVNHPSLLILDEPFEGLDPLGRRMLKDLIRAQRDDGVAVWLCSHQLREADDLCDAIAILHQGRVALHETLDGIRARWPGLGLEQLFHKVLEGEIRS